MITPRPVVNLTTALDCRFIFLILACITRLGRLGCARTDALLVPLPPGLPSDEDDLAALYREPGRPR